MKVLILLGFISMELFFLLRTVNNFGDSHIGQIRKMRPTAFILSERYEISALLSVYINNNRAGHDISGTG
jgi:hypothetical protein